MLDDLTLEKLRSGHREELFPVSKQGQLMRFVLPIRDAEDLAQLGKGKELQMKEPREGDYKGAAAKVLKSKVMHTKRRLL